MVCVRLTGCLMPDRHDPSHLVKKRVISNVSRHIELMLKETRGIVSDMHAFPKRNTNYLAAL